MSSVPLEAIVPNTVHQQAINGPISAHVIVKILADFGAHEPSAVREELEAAVERGDVEHVEDGYQPGEWNEYRSVRAR